MAYSITPTAGRLSYGWAVWVIYSTANNVEVTLPSGCRIAGAISNVQASKSGLYCYTGTTYTPINYGFISGLTQNISGTIDGSAASVTGTRNYCGQIISSAASSGSCTFSIVPNSGYRAYGWLWGKGSKYNKYTTGFTSETTVSPYLSSIVSETYPGWAIVPIERKYYTVIYNGNGSTSGSMSSSEFFYGKNYSLKSCAFTKSATVTYNAEGGSSTRASDTVSFSFSGWATTAAGSAVYSNGQSVSNLTSTAGGTVNLYAKWSGSTVTLPSATKSGSTFLGWYTSASGGTRVGGAGDTYTVTDDVTLHAQWTTYRTVMFSPEGGTIVGDVFFKHVLDGSTYGDLPLASRPGYSFLGWYTSASGGSLVTSSTTVQASDHILYAQWQAATGSATIYFNPAGGDCSQASKSATAGAAYGELPTPTRTGYTFLGWFRSTVGSDQVTSETIATDGSVTVYAHWLGVSLTLTFDANGGTVDEASRAIVYGQQIGRMPTPVKAGFSFLGWYANGVQYTAASYPTASLTLVASWQAAQVFNLISVTVY